MRLFLPFIFLSLYGCTLLAAGIITPSNLVIKPQIIDDELYSETFTLFADIEDGHYIYAQIGVTNIGPGDKKGLCRIMVAHPNKEVINHSEIFDASLWQYNEQPSPTLSVGKCTLTLTPDNHLIFNGNINDTSITVNLIAGNKKDAKNTSRAQATQDIQNDNGRYFSEILIPWSNATASVTTNSMAISKTNESSQDKKRLTGFGYADHSISTLLPSSIASQWIRFRGINSHNSQLLLARFPDEREKPEIWLWQQKKPLNAVTLISENTKDIKKNKMPRFTFEPQTTFGKNTIRHNISAQQLIYRHAPLEEKGLLGKVLSKLIGNPVTYIYRATISSYSDITHTEQPITGILEVSYANE